MIQFTQEQWKKTRQTYKDWWANTLVRPVIFPNTVGSTDLPKPKLTAPVTQKQFADLSITTDELSERIVYDVSRMVYLADGYPLCNMDFTGPGIVSAYLGAELGVSSEGRIWFYPPQNRPEIEALHLSFDEDSPWFQRTLSIIRKVKLLSRGNMVLGFPDLGGVMDILSAFFPSTELFYAMADTPEEVKRLISEIETAWFTVYNRLFAEFEGFAGYSHWSCIYSAEKSYISQCDFSFMLGPVDFDEFVLPTLKKEFHAMVNSIYHLDGSGEVKHLDKLLACKELQAVQWVPGDGNGVHEDYPELMAKILASGKGTFIYGTYPNLLALNKILGTTKGVFMKYDLLPGEDFEKSFAEICKLK
ncbi:MAG: hypothetical protein RSC76_04920 [Oscillospiraceae bacterium]